LDAQQLENLTTANDLSFDKLIDFETLKNEKLSF